MKCGGNQVPITKDFLVESHRAELGGEYKRKMWKQAKLVGAYELDYYSTENVR